MDEKQLQKLKEMFLLLMEKVKRPGVEELINWLNNSDFFYAPASTIYHGSYRGGLLEHSLNVYQALMYETEGLSETYNMKFDEESIIIVSLLHDLCKVNCYVESTRNVKDEKTGVWNKVPCYKREPLFPMGHGGKSVFIIQQFMPLKPEEAQAIYWHMGGYDISNYNTLNELGAAYESNTLAFLLHQADMKATYILENERFK